MKLHNIQISGSIKNNGEDLTQISSSVATTTLDLSNKIAGLSAKTGSVVSGSSQIIYSGITGIPSGIVSGSSQLTGSYDARYVLSGSITQTTWDNIANKPTGIVSGSIQVDLTGVTNYSTFSSSISSSIGSLSGSVATTTSGLSSSVATTTSGLSSSIGSLSSSVATTTSGLSSSIGSLSSSVATTTVNLSSSIGSLSSSVATTTVNLSSSLNSISASISASINSLSGSVATTTFNVSSSLGSISSSLSTTNNNLSSSIGSLSSSVATTDLGIKTRLNTIEGVTGSYATTGSNIFQGNQTITGSLYVSQNLIVAGSSSIQYITSSQLTIGDNIITLNSNSPILRFGGIEVIDSGSSPQVSGSLIFDSINNQWIFVHQFQSGSPVTSSVMITGPETSNNIGNETALTTNRVPKLVSGFHLNDSNTVDDGTTIRHLTNTEITGTLKITGTILSSGTSIFSGSGQVISSLPAGTVSGSSQIDGTAITNKSITIAGTSTSLGGSISAATILTSTGVWSGSAQLPSGVISGSAQVVSSLPSGTVSGSSQVLAGTTIHSGSFFNGITVVSGSGQISFGGITGVPSGLVSGSSQVAFGSISGVPSGLVSGSSQIAFGSITGVPSGLVSGSLQVSLTGTTGFGTYLNQAVLTTSSPTFAGLTSTSALSVGYSITSEPFVSAQFYNTSTQTSTQYGGILVSGINQAHVRFQVGTNSWGATGAKQWQIRVGNGSGADDMRIYSWTYGADVMTLNSSAGVTFAGGVTAGGFTTSGNVTINGSSSSQIILYSQYSGAGNVGMVLNNTAGTTTVSFNSNGGTGQFAGTLYAYGGLQTTGFTLLGSQIYVSGTNNNTLNSGYAGAADNYDLWINYRGYNDAQAYYRNFNIGDGKGNNILWAQGSTGKVVINNGQIAPSDGKLQVYGAIDNIDVSGSSGVFRVYNGTTFRGGFGTGQWAGDSTPGNMAVYSATGQINIWTNGVKRINVDASGNMYPNVNNSYSLGTSSLAWSNIYTNDLHLSNMTKEGGNDIDGTNGNWTIQEGAENLYIINNNNGKKFKISLEEIL